MYIQCNCTLIYNNVTKHELANLHHILIYLYCLVLNCRQPKHNLSTSPPCLFTLVYERITRHTASVANSDWATWSNQSEVVSSTLVNVIGQNLVTFSRVDFYSRGSRGHKFLILNSQKHVFRPVEWENLILYIRTLNLGKKRGK